MVSWSFFTVTTCWASGVFLLVGCLIRCTELHLFIVHGVPFACGTLPDEQYQISNRALYK